MHPLLRLPYRALALAADAIAHTPIGGAGKVGHSLRARRGAVERLSTWAAVHRDPSRPLLWMHAPSVGEGLQARPVLERVRALRPELQVVYTHFSPSAERFAASLGADVADYLPFDRVAHARALLDALRPTALVFSKVDVWPMLTETAAARGVRLGLISATMAAGSARRGTLARALTRDAFAALDAIGAVDEADAGRLVAAGARRERISVTGDTRYDQVAARAAAADRAGTLLAPLHSERPTLVAGSTWPADERVLFPAWLDVRREVPDARLIVVPHEPIAAHLEPIRRWAAGASLSIATLDAARPEHDVVLVDRVGVLGDLYAVADAAYVGGGFHAAGLHSVLEPAAFGAPVLFGPRHHASRDARLLLDCAGAVVVDDAASLARALRIVLTEPDTRGRAGTSARALVQQGLGAADRSATLVERLLSA
ncbi:MAG: glycosyltransferase N-terminal domain-containing protein [Gemmatimonadaceae bacterium]